MVNRWLAYDYGDPSNLVVFAILIEGSPVGDPGHQIAYVKSDFGDVGWSYQNGFIIPPAWEPDPAKRIAAVLLEKNLVTANEATLIGTQPVPVAVDPPII